MWRRQKVLIFMRICIFQRKIRKCNGFLEISGFFALRPCHEARCEGVVARPERRQKSTERFLGAPNSSGYRQNLSKTQHFPKLVFHPKWPPGAPREPPQGPRGRPRDGPGASQGRPGRSQSTFFIKRCAKIEQNA